MTDMSEKPKRGRDVTRTKRVKEFSQRLKDAKGQRVSLDLDGELAGFLAELKAGNYAGENATQADVLRKALREAHDREANGPK